MDPITMAIVAAVASVSSSAIKDSYEALKASLKQRFGEKSDLVEAVNKLEEKPTSKSRKDTVQEEVEATKANDQPEIVRLAQDLLGKIREQPGGQEIISQTQTNTVSGNTVGGDFNFAPVQEGIKKI